MKKMLFHVFLISLCLIGTSSVQAQQSGRPPLKAPLEATEPIFSEGFDNCEGYQFPRGWSSNRSFGNSYGAWQTTVNNNWNATWVPHSGTLFAGFRADGTNANNCWLITPGIQFTAGTAYRIQFWLRVQALGAATTETKDALEVRIGTSSSPQALATSTLIYQLPERMDWTLVTVNFIADTTSNHYIGFQVFSPAYGGGFGLDDVSVSTPDFYNNDLAIQTPDVSSFNYTQIPISQTINFSIQAENVGLHAQHNVKAYAQIDGNIVATSRPLDSLEAFQTERFTISGATAKLGVNNLSFGVSQDETDEDATDNTTGTVLTFTGTNNVFALDNGSGPSFKNNTDIVGNIFNITKTTTLNEVSLRRYIASANIALLSENFNISVYAMTGSTTISENPLIEADGYRTATSGFTPWFSVRIPPTVLNPGSYYVCLTPTDAEKRSGMVIDSNSNNGGHYRKNGTSLSFVAGRANLRLIVDASDAGVTAVTAPNGDLFTNTETLKVNIKNYASAAMSGVYVNAIVNGTKLFETDTLIWESNLLAINAEREFTFPQSLDLSEKGFHTVTAYAYGTGESSNKRSNDTLTVVLNHRNQNDIAPIELIEPQSGIQLSSQSRVTVKIVNEGVSAAANVPVILVLNGAVQATEYIAAISPKDTVDFSFEKRLNLSVEGDYNISILADLPDEEHRSNDTLKRRVHCYSEAIADIRLVGLISPRNDELTNAENITFRVRNNGNYTLTSLPATLTINGEVVLEQTFTTPIPMNAEVDLTFDRISVLENGGAYVADIAVSLANDVTPTDNKLKDTIINSLPYGLEFGLGISSGVLFWEHEDRALLNGSKRIGFNIYIDEESVGSGLVGKRYTLSNIPMTQTFTFGVQVIYESGTSTIIEKEFPGKHPSDIQDIENEDFVIYPNPASDRLFIQSAKTINRVEIYNLQAVLIDVIEHNTNEISVSNLKPGMYILRLTTETGISVYRFIKQ